MLNSSMHRYLTTNKNTSITLQQPKYLKLVPLQTNPIRFYLVLCNKLQNKGIKQTIIKFFSRQLGKIPITSILTNLLHYLFTNNTLCFDGSIPLLSLILFGTGHAIHFIFTAFLGSPSRFVTVTLC